VQLRRDECAGVAQGEPDAQTLRDVAAGDDGADAGRVDASPLLPSAVYADGDGHLLVGRDAARSARLDPARYEPHPKRPIDEGCLLLGSVEVSVVEAIAAVLRRVAAEARRVDSGGLRNERA